MRGPYWRRGRRRSRPERNRAPTRSSSTRRSTGRIPTGRAPSRRHWPSGASRPTRRGRSSSKRASGSWAARRRRRRGTASGPSTSRKARSWGPLSGRWDRRATRSRRGTGRRCCWSRETTAVSPTRRRSRWAGRGRRPRTPGRCSACGRSAGSTPSTARLSCVRTRCSATSTQVPPASSARARSTRTGTP